MYGYLVYFLAKIRVVFCFMCVPVYAMRKKFRFHIRMYLYFSICHGAHVTKNIFEHTHTYRPESLLYACFFPHFHLYCNSQCCIYVDLRTVRILQQSALVVFLSSEEKVQKRIFHKTLQCNITLGYAPCHRNCNEL